MKIESLFKLSSKLDDSFVTLSSINLSGEADGLDRHWRILKGEVEHIPIRPIFEINSEGSFGDLLDTGWPSLYLISVRLQKLLEEEKFTGVKFTEAEILDHGVPIPAKYFVLSIVGKCGAVDYDKCRIEKRTNRNGSLTVWYLGLPVGMQEWDGSDFFLPENSYQVILTDRASRVILSNNFENIRLKPLSQIETAEYGIPPKYRRKE